MLSLKEYLDHSLPTADEEAEEPQEELTQNYLFGINDYIPFKEKSLTESVLDHPTNPKRLVFHADSNSKGGANGLVVPRHMWEGGVKSKAVGMNVRNEMRAKVYGSEHRPPLSLSAIEREHKNTLETHFAKPKSEQIAAEKEAINRLHAAGHLHSKKTTDKGEKTDTVEHEYDEQGRSHVAVSSKGVAGHALYTSGSGADQKHHVLNTCPQQTTGCGGGVDAKGVADTSKGTCFAPNAENQYVNAAIRRACHAQAKHDPAMTNDWALAHTHSLRTGAEAADKKNKRFLFRPNVVDETDRSSKHIIKHLNTQRAKENKPPIIANSYGKTDELHDPENGYHVTHSNTGPKVKNGTEIAENIGRDKKRVRQTISATKASGEDITNEQGNKTPPKGSYMVINQKRNSPMAKEFEKHVTHAKYWSTGRSQDELSDEEKAEGEHGHYDGQGKPTAPENAHYGHTTINGNRYDYQKQHVLHPRMVAVKDAKNVTHKIPTDSRFKDEEHLPKDRYMSKNGKKPGGILITTPTESTDNIQHHTSFTHHVDANTIEHAKRNNGEYEIDNPHEQEKAKGKAFAAPQAVQFVTRKNGSKLDKSKQPID